MPPPPQSTLRCPSATAAAMLALAVAVVPAASAQQQAPQPSAVREAVGFDPPLGASVPLDLAFVGDDGRRVTLADCAGGRPVVLALVYYDCPMLCNEVVDGLVRSLTAMSLVAGEDYSVVLASIDPREGWQQGARRRARIRSTSGGRAGGAGWSLLTGGEAAIGALAAAVGFRFRYVPATGEYAHAAGIAILGPGGRLSRAFRGIDYPPRDLRLGLVEASRGEVGTLVDRVLLLCYRWDPSVGRYGLAIRSALTVGGLATVLALAAGIGLLLRRERAARRARDAAARRSS